jgi:hypothetical protein
MENYSNDNFNKKIDIESKKKELEKKYGTQFCQFSDISPELESEWLSQIEQFEEQYSNNEKTTVWEYIEKPSYKKINEIESEDLEEELTKLMDYMNNHGIALDILCDVEDKEIYRFITEELFFHKIDNVHIEGMMNCFTYEEFHPNAEFDIRSAFEYFFDTTMSKTENIGSDGFDLLYVDTDNYKRLNGEQVAKSEVLKSINQFLKSFDYFEIISNEIKNVFINQDKTDAKLTFEIKYKGCFAKSAESVNFEGSGYFKLKPSQFGGWDIYHINLPGLKIQ